MAGQEEAGGGRGQEEEEGGEGGGEEGEPGGGGGGGEGGGPVLLRERPVVREPPSVFKTHAVCRLGYPRSAPLANSCEGKPGGGA